MREIRFRLWDKENKKMIVRDSLYTYFIGLLGDIGRHDVCGNATYNNGYKFYSEQFELMQYTGLKDKNGQEIYEGDIVIANLKYFNIENEKCKVIFENGSFGIQYGYCNDYFKPFSAWDDCKVIGNIHDNPELLDG